MYCTKPVSAETADTSRENVKLLNSFRDNKIKRQCDLTWCAAADGRAGENISHSRSSGKVWRPGVCAGAGPGMMRWRRTWCSEDTCEPLPLCAFWSESAYRTWRRRSADILYTWNENTARGQTPWGHTGHMAFIYCMLCNRNVSVPFFFIDCSSFHISFLSNMCKSVVQLCSAYSLLEYWV